MYSHSYVDYSIVQTVPIPIVTHSDNRGIHKREREFALSALAEMLCKIPELIHRHVIIFEDEELVGKMSCQLILLMFGTEADQKRAHPVRNLLLFMHFLALGNDMILDTEDFELLLELDGASQFSFYDSQKQFKDHGICIQLSAVPKVPEQQENVPILTFGNEEISFLVDISRLSALGFSAFSLLLVPNSRTKNVFMKVVDLVDSFNNCFIAEIKRNGISDTSQITSREPQKIEKQRREVFVPLAWVYKFELSSDFLNAHGSVGSIGALLGNTDYTHPQGQNGLLRKMVLDFKNLVSLCFRSLKWGNKEKGLAVYEANEENLSDYGDGGHEKNRRLFLDNGFNLVYDETPGWQFRLKGATVAAKAVVGEATVELEHQTPAFREPRITRFNSFQQFITFRFRNVEKDGFMTRMIWLENALEERNLFPNGSNQSLLKNVISEHVSCNQLCDIFAERDCRVKCKSLKKPHLPFRALQLIKGNMHAGECMGYVYFEDVCSQEREVRNIFMLPFEWCTDGISFTDRCRIADQRERVQLRNAENLSKDLL